MRLGEMAHRLETSIEAVLGQVEIQSHQLDPLQTMVDHMAVALKGLRGVLNKAAVAAESGNTSEPSTTGADDTSSTAELNTAVVVAEPTAPLVAAAPVDIDWSRFTSSAAQPTQTAAAMQSASTGVVRVRAGLLDRLVNSAGEVSIRRARIESDVRQLQGALVDLTDSLDRMRRELRDIELQAETQISSRIEAAKVSAQSFDPLEMDRFTRLQELTRMMAESVNDVATLQRGLQRTLQSTEDQLAAQSRLTREMQDDLLRTRMVEFESMADRLYRVVRLTARDTGKQVRLDIVGGSIEVDRGVLERMVGSFEHLLRNSVVHGIELPSARTQAGKEPSGTVVITATQAGNEVVVEFADDGAGLDMQRIRDRAVERGLLAADHNASDAELAQLIFLPGFSTANTVTEHAGRGIGMDVVRAEVNAMGGRIENHSVAGLGMRLRLVLPLTTAVTQVVMLRCGSVRVAVPSTLVELVRRVPTDQVRQAHLIGQLPAGEEAVPFFWLASLIEGGSVPAYSGRSQAVVIVRSASQRVALHVDEVIGNQEVVVKNLGPQLSRMPGLAGVTLLPSGAVALIYNPVALMALYGAELQRARAATSQALVQQTPNESAVVVQDQRPLVMVVDDSLTVRRVTQRLLERMVGSFEHLLRNSVVHGIELPSARTQAGKAPSGTVVITATQAGNEVVVEFADDGAGLDMQRIRARAVERGQLAADHNASEAELAQLIFLPGFSTANTVTELAGRGIGMDVVRAEVNAMGGRIENHSVAGRGMRLRLVLPLTTAVTQVVMLRCGSVRVAVPSTLVELVRRVPTDQVRQAHLIGQLPAGEEAVPFFWLASLIEGGSVPAYSGRSQAVVIVRSASQRVALHVDEVIGNQEVVVKNLGPQLARMPGLAGVTLLPSGTVALIYNPVALLALYGAELQRERVATDQTLVHQAPPESVVVVQDQRPLVMVVDDSLTVRRVTQRLLEREGYRVSLAKDGIDALERLAQERPLVMLCDIEMPRMDGFELVRNLRADPERAAIPVIMITSRIAQKHRDHAAQLGVEHYLGKPFAEEALLALVMKYTQPVLIR